MNEQEILNKLFEIEVKESRRIFKESSRKNPIIISLKNTYEDFLRVEKDFHFYIDTLYTLFEAEECPFDKTLAIKVRGAISNLSRNIGKLDEALTKNPPMAFKDIEAANSYISRVKDVYQRLSEKIEDPQVDKTIELKELYELFKVAYSSLKVRITEFNNKVETQKLLEL